MSDASARGLYLERQVAAMLRKKLGARVERDRRSGAGVNKSDISDYYQQIPLHLEVKNQETVKIKEWFRQADAAASFAQAPTVVFSMDEEILSVLRFSDLVNFMVEIADQKAEIDDLHKPPPGLGFQGNMSSDPNAPGNYQSDPIAVVTDKAPDKPVAYFCREGHIADQYGYCQQLDCKYSRGYRKPKAKRR